MALFLGGYAAGVASVLGAIVLIGAWLWKKIRE